MVCQAGAQASLFRITPLLLRVCTPQTLEGESKSLTGKCFTSLLKHVFYFNVVL